MATEAPSRAAASAAWEENDRLRTEASAEVARAAREAGVQRLVQESIAFVYADGGDAWLDDAATAITAAVDAPAGTYNVADADPPTNAEIDTALAAVVGVQALRPRAPQDGPLARSQRVTSRRLREASGWAPRMRAGTETWERLAA